ncbi:MAG: hypothetical protein IT480_19345 [Gammaproteobacteria bacterium]|nr:hypothetical protein [Gammaproteobacteria bacterium]
MKVPLHGVIGGGVASANGGSFRDGFLFAAGATAAFDLYRGVTTKYEPTWSRGRHLDVKPDLDTAEPATPLGKNIGVHNDATLAHNWFWKVVPRYEGNWLFEGLNYIPGFNSFATLHDWFMARISNPILGAIVNVPSMGPALAVKESLIYSRPMARNWI